jgi:hypothetical protein
MGINPNPYKIVTMRDMVRMATIIACDFAGALMMAAVPTPAGIVVGSAFLATGAALTILDYIR